MPPGDWRSNTNGDVDPAATGRIDRSRRVSRAERREEQGAVEEATKAGSEESTLAPVEEDAEQTVRSS